MSIIAFPGPLVGLDRLDRDWFAANPNRQHRARMATQAESRIAHSLDEALPRPIIPTVLIRRVTPGVFTRRFTTGRVDFRSEVDCARAFDLAGTSEQAQPPRPEKLGGAA